VPITLQVLSADALSTLAADNMGDIDGDGADELAVGSKYSADGCYKCGAAYIIDGPTSAGYVSDNALVTILGPDELYSYFGQGVNSAGDLNGDGYPDLVVGASGLDSYGYTTGGAAYVFFGSTSASSSISADDDAGFVLYGDATYSYIGEEHNVDGLGDLDGDGYDDLGVATQGDNFVYIMYGSTSLSGATAASSADAVLQGSSSYGFGYNISGLGDLDGDGYDDFSVGKYSEGSMEIFAGSSTRIASGDSSATQFVDSANSYPYLDSTIPKTGDFNNDGHTDIVVADRYYGSSTYAAGGTYAFYGPLSLGSQVDVSTADSNLTGDSNASYPYFGTSLASGDFDGDGADDLAVAQPGTANAYLFSGGSW